MKKIILILVLLLFASSCATTGAYKAHTEKRGYMIEDQINLPRNKKYFEQNLKKRYKHNKRRYKKGKHF